MNGLINPEYGRIWLKQTALGTVWNNVRIIELDIREENAFNSYDRFSLNMQLYPLMAHIASLEQRLTESSDRESKLIAQAETSQDTIRGILGENTRLNQLLIAGPAEASNFVDITPVKKPKKKPKKKQRK